MRVQRAVALAGLAVAILLPPSLEASGLPACRVRFTTSGFAPSVSDQIVGEVASSIMAPDQGCILVPEVSQADVLLEINDYAFKPGADGTPTHWWFFTSRRLGEPDPSKAVHRSGVSVAGPAGKATEHGLGGHAVPSWTSAWVTPHS